MLMTESNLFHLCLMGQLMPGMWLLCLLCARDKGKGCYPSNVPAIRSEQFMSWPCLPAIYHLLCTSHTDNYKWKLNKCTLSNVQGTDHKKIILKCKDETKRDTVLENLCIKRSQGIFYIKTKHFVNHSLVQSLIVDLGEIVLISNKNLVSLFL